MLKSPTCGWLLLAVFAASAAGDDRPPFKIATGRDNDRVEVTTDQERAIFAVRSPDGISHAVIQRAGEQWPAAVIVRLHLPGLEHFQAANGRVTLKAAVSSRDEKRPVRLWKDGQEDRPLDPQSPYWMDIRRVGGEPATALPPHGGYFEVRLPRALFAGNPPSITVNWIDFYRN